ncbi:MAG: chromosome segregation protein SMC, partial [Limnochordia bacterium]
WLQYMKTENLISGSRFFGSWSVDSGPRVWDDRDIWSEIQGALVKDDVAQAAWLLRRYLEYTATILADNLRARIEFRSDGRYDLGDILPHVLKQWRELLNRAEKSAAKWMLDETRSAIAATRDTAKDLAAKTNMEQWTINPSVHFNEWANLQAAEFQEVVDAFKELLEHLRCHNPACRSYLYVSPRKGQPEVLRCNCGSVAINLKAGA